MSFAMPSLDAIRNLAEAQQSLSAANQAYDNWKARNEQNEAELKTLLALQSALNEEKSEVEHAVAEGTKLLHETWMSLGRPPAPVALPESPPPQSAPPAPKKAAKIPSQDERDAMSEDQRNAFLSGRMSKEQERALSKGEKKERRALKKAAHDERAATRSPEQQAKIDLRVAAMTAGRQMKASPARALEAELKAASAAGGESV